MNIFKKLAKNPLLIAIIVTALLICIVGAVFAVKGENPIDSFMINVRDDGFTTEADNSTNSDTDSDTYTSGSGNRGPSRTEDSGFNKADTTWNNIDKDNDKDKDKDKTTDKHGPHGPGNDTTKNTQTDKDKESTDASTSTTSSTSSTTSTTSTTTSTSQQASSQSTAYFNDALFIGDSRTVGFYQYAPIEGAKYFARTSMSIYNIFNSSKSETGTGDASLETYLKNNKFGKIYILLGINEIGGSLDAIANEYVEVLDKIKQLQPGAKIIIQSNMHVSATKSANNPNSFNNKRIDELNSKLAKLADNRTVFFLNFTHVFDDENGNLRSDYTSDGVHFYAKCYKEWRNWIVENGKV